MIIGVLGKKRSGKDTTSNVLINDHGYTKYQFARPLKNACKEIFMWDEGHVEGDLKDEIDPRWGISPRQAMQYIGTDVGREGLSATFPAFAALIGSDIWVKRFGIWLDRKTQQSKQIGIPLNVVIPDVRFQNEIDAIWLAGGIIIKVVRPELEAMQNEDQHKSEKFIDLLPYDYLIECNSPVQRLMHKVENLYLQIIKERML